MVDTHGPDTHGLGGFGIQARDITNGVFVHATKSGSSQRIPTLDFGFEGFVIGTIRIDVFLLLQALFQDHMRHSIEQNHIGPGRDSQVHIGHLREHGDTRIDYDHWELALLQRLFQTPINHRVLLRQIGTEGDQAFGMVEIFVAAGRAVAAERALVTRHRRCHAQRGIAVVVVGANHATREFTQGVELFRHDLAGRDNRKRIAAISVLNALNFCRGLV